MLTTTYNKLYTCDRCGKKETYVHHREDWTPAGWYELVGRGGVNVEPIHFCRDCFRSMFWKKGVDYADADKAPKQDSTVGGVLSSIKLSDYKYVAKPSDDDYEDFIGLTD